MSDTIIFRSHCTLCHQDDSFEVRREGWEAWMQGSYVQTALPELPKERREQMISGTCGPCFDKLFAPEKLFVLEVANDREAGDEPLFDPKDLKSCRWVN